MIRADVAVWYDADHASATELLRLRWKDALGRTRVAQLSIPPGARPPDLATKPAGYITAGAITAEKIRADAYRAERPDDHLTPEDRAWVRHHLNLAEVR